MISTRFTLHSLVTEAHKTLRPYLTDACVSLDATMGNGHDTLFLARYSAKVYAFDIQAHAINSTCERLQKAGYIDRCTLFHAGHELLTSLLPKNEKLDVIMFNLGYLPHADTTIITQTSNTLSALNATLEHLSEKGIISILVYPGHKGGETEMQAIIDWYQNLDDHRYAITLIHSRQETPQSPRLFIISVH